MKKSNSGHVFSLAQTFFVAAASLLATNCTKQNETYCAADLSCPDGMVCSTSGNVCVSAQFTFDYRGLYFFENVQWTTSLTPLFTGTVEDDAATVVALVNGEIVATAEVVDGAWSMQIPAGILSETATPFVFQQILDGRIAEISENFAVDLNPPVATPAVTKVFDESKDVIRFVADGTPSHEHQGAQVDLGGDSCATVTKYGYLYDSEPPRFVTESVRNPVEFRYALASRFGIHTASYRIVGKNSEVLSDWRDAYRGSQSGTQFGSVKISRSDVPELSGDGQFFLEWRFSDWAGRITTAKSCWKQKVLAAPLATTGVRLSTLGPRSIGGWKLNSPAPVPPVSTLIAGTAPTHIFESAIINGTAEPIEFEATVNAPLVRAEGERFIADRDERNTAESPFRLCAGSTAPECRPGIPSNDSFTPFVRDVQTPKWTIRLLDDLDAGVGICTLLSETSVRCRLEGRTTTPVRARLVAALQRLPELNPGDVGSPVGEFAHVFLGGVFSYTGNPIEHVVRCGFFDEINCRVTTQWDRHTILSKAKVTVSLPVEVGNVRPGPGFNLKPVNSGQAALPAYPTNTFAARPVVWDGGTHR